MILFAVTTIFFLFANSLKSEPVPGSNWDGDGGFTHDYSGIARLEWMGPGEPDTYQDYLLRRGTAPFFIDHLFSSDPGRSGDRTEKALVLVNNSLYSGIQEKLDRYVSDLENSGYSVEVHTTTGGTPQDLKSFIIDHWDDLAGCVFVGDLPVAWYEHEDEDFPCDLYYMDLDGEWIDNDSDGMWDEHTAGSGDEGPEIFIGHIDTSMMSGSEASMTNDYLDKNHAYRTGAFFGPGFALTYTEDDWAGGEDIRTEIKYSYPCFQDIPAPDTNRDDYVDNRVPNTDYEFIQLACHSWSSAHTFTRGGWAWYFDIKAAIPRAMFFNLFACSSLRFTAWNFLGGSYIYNTSDTSLAVIGSTKSGSMLVFWAFYQPFGEGKTFGEAFRDWFNYLAPYNNSEIGWHFGMTIAGDPFLKRTGYPPAIVDIAPDSGPVKGGTRVTITGSDFNYGITSVLFGDNEATGVTVEDENNLSCDTPQGDSIGYVNVSVSSLFGTDVLVEGFEYLPSAPEVLDVNPDESFIDVETFVTITGDFFTFTGDTQVLFGSNTATGMEVVDTNTITCYTPAITDYGFVDVTVINSNGSGTLENGFRYLLHTPEIYYVDPDHGSTQGGNLVTITGDHLADSAYVFFAWLTAGDITCIDRYTITCRPPEGQGTVDVTVMNEQGGYDVLTNGYTYVDTPEIYGISPEYGHALGGDGITVTGTNFTFTEDTDVKFGDTSAPWLNVIDSTTIECTSPAHSAGPVDVMVINSNGSGTLSNGFEYLDKPALFFLGGDVVPESPVAFKVRAPDRPNENFCILVNNQLGPTYFPNLGITIDLAIEGFLIKYNSFGGGGNPDLNSQGERTCVVNVPAFPPGLIYWQAIVGELDPVSLMVSNRVDLEIAE